MSIRLGFMQDFMREIFPRLGIGLAVLTVLLILVGLFINEDERKYWNHGLAAVAGIIVIVIVTQSFDMSGLTWFGAWDNYVGFIIGGVLLIGLIIAVATSGGEHAPKK